METKVLYKNEEWMVGISEALLRFKMENDLFSVIIIYKEFDTNVCKLTTLSELTIKGGEK